MASYITRGESVFFQFRNGKSVMNSQCKPRMFKTAEKAMLGVNYVDTDDIVEYSELKHGRWINERMLVGGFGEIWGCDCSVCGETFEVPLRLPYYCSNCGAKMDLEG